jgi:hypothetical protein
MGSDDQQDIVLFEWAVEGGIGQHETISQDLRENAINLPFDFFPALLLGHLVLFLRQIAQLLDEISLHELSNGFLLEPRPDRVLYHAHHDETWFVLYEGQLQLSKNVEHLGSQTGKFEGVQVFKGANIGCLEGLEEGEPVC